MYTFEDLQSDIDALVSYRQRLYHCSAQVCETPYGYVLKSYNTYVAIYSREQKHLVVLGRFSHTTYQHVSKFKKWLLESGEDLKTEENIELVNWFK